MTRTTPTPGVDGRFKDKNLPKRLGQEELNEAYASLPAVVGQINNIYDLVDTKVSGPTPEKSGPLDPYRIAWACRVIMVDPSDPNGNKIWWAVNDNLGFTTDAQGDFTWQGLPSGVGSGYSIHRMVRRINDALYIMVMAGSDCKILRSTNEGASWVAVHTLTSGSTSFPYALSCDAQYVYAADYGDPQVSGTPAAKLYRSANGVDWETVRIFDADQRHVHSITPDPFRAGHVWVTTGDSSTETLWRSTDYGAMWTHIPNYGSTRLADQISFTETHIYATPDNSFTDLIVLDRQTRTPRNGTIGDHRQMGVPNPGTYLNGEIQSGSNVFVCGGPTYYGHFNPSDEGRSLTANGVPAGTRISKYVNEGRVELSNPATVTNNQVVFTVDRAERFKSGCRHGAVDPETGIYYFATSEDYGSNPGFAFPREGLFCIPSIGAAPILIAALRDGHNSVLVEGGKVCVGAYVFKAFR